MTHDASAPNIQVGLNGGTTKGFSILFRNRVDVIGLLSTCNNVNAAVLDVLITEK